MKTTVVILVLILIGGFLRIYGLDKNPVSLNVDEVSEGYNAYSILKTGRDEYGYFLPLSFKSLGDYKPPIYIYTLVPSIFIFGLNEFSIRFPAALFDTLSIPLFYFLVKELTSKKSYALLGAFLFSISAWNIYHSRFALETPLATSFVILGLLFFLKFIKRAKILAALLSALFFALSMYTYQTERLFTPLFLFLLVYLFRDHLLINKKRTLIFVGSFFLIILPLIGGLVFGPDKTRAQVTFLARDVDFVRNVLVSEKTAGQNNFDQSLLLVTYWFNKSLSYLDLQFIFFDGLGLRSENKLTSGLMYVFELPLLFYGLFFLIRNKFPNKLVIFGWVILGILPASLTLGELSARRSLIISPVLMLVCAVGLAEIWVQGKKYLASGVQVFAVSAFLLLVFWELAYTVLLFGIHFPLETGEGFMEGNKEAVSYILEHQSEYQEIVFDPVRGVQGPYIVSVPHLYILFYSKYDPGKYQNQTKIATDKIFKFDKYTIRPINWRADRQKKGVLFIGSPWSLPAQDIDQSEILKRIYLSNGQLVLLIVTPNK